MSKKELDVVAAVIKDGDKYLLCQRNEDDDYGLLWEFPGGCIEEGENHPQAIKREIKEELDVDIEVGELISEFSDESPVLKIRIFLFSCSIKAGTLDAKDCKDFGFFSIGEFDKVALAPADKKIYSYFKNLD